MSSTPSKSQTVPTLHDCLSRRVHHQGASAVSKQEIQNPTNQTCFLLDQVLTPEECRAIIDRTEHEVGFVPALLNIGGGRQVYSPEDRNSDRCIVDDEVFADQIFARIKQHLPVHYTDRYARSTTEYEVVGLNERMRVLRYKRGHSFPTHMDGSYVRPDGSEISFCTIMIYLSSGGGENPQQQQPQEEAQTDFEGGSTAFYSSWHYPSADSRFADVVPKRGQVLVFDHKMLHEGSTVHSGTKYAIRTDLMYRKMP